MIKDNVINYSLSNGRILTFNTHPDIFSPKSIDKGTLAMINSTSISTEEKVLDLGCGFGFVGVYIAAEYGVKAVTMCDIDPLAVEFAQKNIKLNRLEYINVLQSDGLDRVEDCDYTLILSNPPYHTDFAVAKHFIEQGFRHLQIGGRMVMVVKRLLWYKNKLNSIFGGVRVKQVDDYYVLTAEKRAEIVQNKEKKIKPKHQRRLEKTKKRKNKSNNKQ